MACGRQPQTKFGNTSRPNFRGPSQCTFEWARRRPDGRRTRRPLQAATPSGSGGPIETRVKRTGSTPVAQCVPPSAYPYATETHRTPSVSRPIRSYTLRTGPPRAAPSSRPGSLAGLERSGTRRASPGSARLALWSILNQGPQVGRGGVPDRWEGATSANGGVAQPGLWPLRAAFALADFASGPPGGAELQISRATGLCDLRLSRLSACALYRHAACTARTCSVRLAPNKKKK